MDDTRKVMSDSVARAGAPALAGPVPAAGNSISIDLRLAEEAGTLLRARGWTCGTAESCTGGTIAGWITAISGSSDYFQGGIVAYSNDVKQRLLGVSPQTLARVGAVSAECAGEMARGARETLGVDLAISSTGIAGPLGATARKPVGLVYIAVATPDGEQVRELRLDGDRLSIITAATRAALGLAVEQLRQLPHTTSNSSSSSNELGATRS
jgi:PncC family amidohydrolase